MEVANCIYGNKARYVPQIFMNDKKVGGFGELYGMHQNGQLVKNEEWFILIKQQTLSYLIRFNGDWRVLNYWL